MSNWARIQFSVDIRIRYYLMIQLPSYKLYKCVPPSPGLHTTKHK